MTRLLLALGLIAGSLGLLLPVRPSSAAELDDPREQAAVEWIATRAPDMERELRGFVDRNTGSANLAGLTEFGAELSKLLEPLGFRGVLLPGRALGVPGREDVATGPIVIARRPARSPGPSAPRTLLLNGHYDTVFEPDHPFQGYFRDAGNPERARGPGVADMKGGLVVMLTALRALERVGALDDASWIVVLNADEELGSLASRETLEELAAQADVGLVFESARDNGAMVSSRRGLGQFRLAVEGVAAHAGGAHADGRSAIRALAEKVLAVEALTDYGRGLTLNVGTFQGGTKRNVVPKRAVAWIDLRYDEPSLGDEARRALEEIAAKSSVVGTNATLWGRLHRPPKLLDPAMRELLAAHSAVALDLGIPLPEPVHAGGGTDGSLFAARGLPTLDSVGVVGGGAHTEREFIVLSSLVERAQLAAVLMLRLARDAALRSSGRGVD